MSFRQFAFNNVRRNGRAYFAFFLSSAFMVMIFFTYAMFIFHPGIQESDMGKMTRTGMVVAEYIIFIFSFLFVLYSISTFLKARNKEFGVLSLLGASAGQINRLIFLENMLIGIVSIATGIGSGMLLSKVFLLLSSYVVQFEELPFYWPGHAILLTFTAFMALFLVISFFTLVFIRKNRVLELLQGSSKPKKEPKTSIWLMLLGLALLVISVINLPMRNINGSHIIIAAFTGIAGTYFFYTQLTVPIIRLLKKNRRFFWRGSNLLWLSEMAYKLKDNARMLFMVNVFIALACMSVGLVLALDIQNKQTYERQPYSFVYHVYNESTAEEETAGIDEQLGQYGVEFDKISLDTLGTTFRNDQTLDHPYGEVVSLSQLRRATASLPLVLPQEIPQKEGFLIYGSESRGELAAEDWDYVDIHFGDTRLPLAGNLQADLFVRSGYLLVVDDQTYSELTQAAEADGGSRTSYRILYYIPEWNESPPPRMDDEEAVLSLKIKEWMWSRDRSNEAVNHLQSNAEDYLTMKQSTSVLSFIGVFVAAIFSIASASFLYFKLYSELNQDRHIYRSLSKIGLNQGEMRKSATLQMAVLFFIPIVISAIQALVVLTPLGHNFELPVTTMPVLIASGTFLIAQCLYFIIVRSRYVIQLKRVMV